MLPNPNSNNVSMSFPQPQTNVVADHFSRELRLTVYPVFDPCARYRIYVPNTVSSDAVSVISTATNTVIGTSLQLVDTPWGNSGFDSANNREFMSQIVASDTVSVIDDRLQML